MSLCNFYGMNDIFKYKYITYFGCKKFNNSFILLIIYFCLRLCVLSWVMAVTKFLEWTILLTTRDGEPLTT